MIETWRSIDGRSGYQVSDLGRVRRGEKVRTLTPDAKGYLRVSFWEDGKAVKVGVHILVAAAFIGARPPGLVVRHANGDKSNNSAENLIYGTQVENEADKVAHGTKAQGERHGAAKLTEEQVREIRRRYVPRATSLRSLGAEFGISARTVHQIVRRQKWAHVE